MGNFTLIQIFEQRLENAIDERDLQSCRSKVEMIGFRGFPALEGLFLHSI
jgi:hypothetical protein